MLREALVLRGSYGCIQEPGHILDNGLACTRTHPPLDLATLRTMISVAQAISVLHDHGFADPYQVFESVCQAGDARAGDVKAGAEGKDIIIWIGHGGPGGWAWVLDDFIGSCGPSDLYIGGPDDAGISAIDFGGTCPVVFAGSCLTGAYARETGRSIAQAFLRLGAAVYIGNTEVQGVGACQEVALDYFSNYWNRSGISVGQAMKEMKANMARHRWARRSWDIYEMNTYGDPKFGDR